MGLFSTTQAEEAQYSGHKYVCEIDTQVLLCFHVIFWLNSISCVLLLNYNKIMNQKFQTTVTNIHAS